MKRARTLRKANGGRYALRQNGTPVEMVRPFLVGRQRQRQRTIVADRSRTDRSYGVRERARF